MGLCVIDSWEPTSGRTAVLWEARPWKGPAPCHLRGVETRTLMFTLNVHSKAQLSALLTIFEAAC